MGEGSINSDCQMVAEIARLILQSKTDKDAKALLQRNAVEYISELINCIDTYDKHVSWQGEINESLQIIADSSGRRADIYEEMHEHSLVFTKQLMETMFDLVNTAANRVVVDMVNALNTAGILKEGFVIEHPAPFEIIPPVSIDVNEMTITGGIDQEKWPTLTINATRQAATPLPDDVLFSTSETDIIDFKREFHSAPLSKESVGAWCELIKDIVAMANSEGGYILIGLSDDGTPSDIDVSAFANIDPAIISDKIYSYTRTYFNDFHLFTTYKAGKLIAILRINEAWPPLVFADPGNYINRQGKQKSAFNVGSVYVRHSAKSEPLAPGDMHKIIDKALIKDALKMRRAFADVFSGTVEEVIQKLKAFQQQENSGGISADDSNSPDQPKSGQ